MNFYLLLIGVCILVSTVVATDLQEEEETSEYDYQSDQGENEVVETEELVELASKLRFYSCLLTNQEITHSLRSRKKQRQWTNVRYQ
jgi:hypothetical protein